MLIMVDGDGNGYGDDHGDNDGNSGWEGYDDSYVYGNSRGYICFRC